jgi:hypothetical protein
LWLVAGCSGLGPGSSPHPEVEPYLGAYRGSFDSAFTETPADDLNHNPCEPAEGRSCLTHDDPLTDILLELRRGPDGAVSLAFYRDEQHLAAGRTLDLLGRGCGTRLGPLASVKQQKAQDELHTVATFPLDTDNRLCLGKLRPVSRHQVNVEMRSHAGADAGAPMVRVVIDKNLRDTNYLYVVEDGVRRRVRIDLENTVHGVHRNRYRVCIEDDHGEYDRCVLTDREFRSFALPLPVPGGIALNYTWWQELSPRLRRTEGRYVVERYVGRFEMLTADPADP